MNAEHERFSELLAPYLRGDLDGTQARSVEEHLASCPECRAERVTLAALLEPVEKMTDIERARLHRAVWDRVGATAAPGPRTPLMTRLAPVLGTAAVIVLIAVGIVTSTGGGDDSDSGGDGDMSAETLDDGGGGRDLGNDALPGAEEGTESTALAAQEAPYFDESAGNLSAPRLARVAEEPSFSNYRSLYDAPQANDLALEFLEILADKAGKRSGAVLDCGRVVIDNRGGTALAAYGGIGMFEKREALVLGFATSSDAQRLNRYSFWIFAPDDCSRSLRIEEGNLGD